MPSTAPDEMMGADFSRLTGDPPSRVSDALLRHKKRLEKKEEKASGMDGTYLLRTIRNLLSTRQRVIIAFKGSGGKHHALRVNPTPEAEHKIICDSLALGRNQLPQRHHFTAK